LSRCRRAIGFQQLICSANGRSPLSYGPDLIDLYRRAPVYIDRILHGARPSELPVQEPTKFELVVNLATALSKGRSGSDELITAAAQAGVARKSPAVAAGEPWASPDRRRLERIRRAARGFAA
jgi:hypothetical protein